MPNPTLPKLYAVDRFTWERIVRNTDMKPTAVKLLALILATYADGNTAARNVDRARDYIAARRERQEVAG